MKQNRKFQSFGQKPFGDELQVIRFAIPRAYDIETLWLSLDFVEAITVARGAVRQTGRYEFIRRIRLLVNEQAAIFDMGGFEALMLALMDRNATFGGAAGVSPANSSGANAWNTVGGNTVANQTTSLALPIDFSSIDYLRPKDTALRTAAMQSLTLEVTLGALTDAYQSTGGTSSIIPGTGVLSVSGIMLDEQTSDDGRSTSPLYLRRRFHVTDNQINTTAHAAQYRLPMPTGVLVKNVILVARNRLTGAPVGDIFTRVRLQQQELSWVDLSGIDIRRFTSAFCLPDGTNQTTTRIINFGRTLARMGKISDCLDLRSAKLAEVVYDVNVPANTRVDLIVDALTPIGGAPA